AVGGLVKTAPGGSIVVNPPLLSKKPCLRDIGSVGSRYVPTMSPRPLIAAARVKLAPGISIAMNCPLPLRKKPWVPLASLYDPTISPVGLISSATVNVPPGKSIVAKVESSLARALGPTAVSAKANVQCQYEKC